MNKKQSLHVPIELHQPTWIFPKDFVDLNKWSVIACDQYTSDEPYWNEVNQIVGDFPSTLHFIYPEVYLETDTLEQEEHRIHSIHESMKSCLSSNDVKKIKGGLFAIERTTSHNKVRRGIVCCIDLEDYDFTLGSTSLIRASEATVTSRIPPRLKVRHGASLESSHILLLMDDPKLYYMNIIFDQLFEENKETYQTTLMTKAGSIRGMHLPADHPKTVAFIDALNNHNMKTTDHLLFAVGDGNHSLATAKTYWNEIKESKVDPISKQSLSDDDLANHPARFAMVEILSLSDPGLDFEPIHQVLFDMDMHDFIKEATNYYGDAFSTKEKTTKPNVLSDCQFVDEVSNQVRNTTILCLANGTYYELTLTLSPNELTLSGFRKFLDHLIETKKFKTDYIHDLDPVIDLCMNKKNIGLLFPKLSSTTFFDQIIHHGILPRKAFSLGSALDKRFYMECRSLLTK